MTNELQAELFADFAAQTAEYFKLREDYDNRLAVVRLRRRWLLNTLDFLEGEGIDVGKEKAALRDSDDRLRGKRKAHD